MVKSVYSPEAGGVLHFPDDATPKQMLAYIDSKYGAPAPAPTPAAPEVGPWESSGLSFLSRFQTTGGGIAEMLGSEGYAKYLYDKAEANKREAEKYTPEQQSIWEAQGVGGKATALKEAAIQSAPDLAGGLAAGYAGGEIGAAIGGGIGTVAAGPVGTGIGGAVGGTLGAMIGAGTYAFGSLMGSNIQRQAQEQGVSLKDANEVTAAEAAAVQAPLEALADKVMLGRLIPSGLGASAIRNIVGAGVITHAAKSAVTEGLTEAAQQAIEIGQANPEKLFSMSPDVQTELIDSALAGGFLGGGVSIGLKPFEKYTEYRRGKGQRQLQADLAQEKNQNLTALRNGLVSQGADKMKAADVSGGVVIDSEINPLGNNAFTIKNKAGDVISSFDNEDDAIKSVELYRSVTGHNVPVHKKTATPKMFPVAVGGKKYNSLEDIGAELESLHFAREDYAQMISTPEAIKKNAADAKVPEPFFKSKIEESIARNDARINTLKSYLTAAREGVAPKAAVKVVPEAPRKAVQAGPEISDGVPAPTQETPPQAPEENTIMVSESEAAPEGIAAIGAAAPITDTEEPTLAEMMDVGAVDEIPAEMPIGTGEETPIEEDRSGDIQAVDIDAAKITEPQKPLRSEDRPSATADQLADLQTELFGRPMNVREMTPDQLAEYTKTRDERFPPVSVDVFYNAGQTPDKNQPTAVKPSETVIKNDDTTNPEWRKRVYTALSNRLKGIVPENVMLNLETFIDSDQRTLYRGREFAVEGTEGLRRVIDLASGILRPGMTVEQAVAELSGTMNHEAIHSLRALGLIRDSEWRTLARSATTGKVAGKSYTYLEKAEAVYTPNGIPISEAYADPDAVVEEAVAEMYREWVNKNNAPPPSRGILNRIREFFRRVFQVLRNTSHNKVFNKIESGEIARRDVRVSNRGARLSAGPAYDPTTSTSDWEQAGAPPPGISSVNQTGGSPFRISQRRPVGARTVGQSLANNLLIDVAAMKQTPDMFDHNINVIRQYVDFPEVLGETSDQTLARFKQQVVDNLLWLHDTMDPTIRSRAKLWYDGARAITTDLAKRYNLPDTTVAAVMAGLSPQKDWFQNVSLAERVIDISITKADHKFDDKMIDAMRAATSMEKYMPLVELMQGKTLNEIGSLDVGEILARKHNEINAGIDSEERIRSMANGVNTYGRAIFVRFYDQAYNSREYNIITPEGAKSGIAKTKDGVPTSVAWGSLPQIGNSVNAIMNGNKESIDALLGNRHKIRNFYNNIISPKSQDGSVTIDTHAVAAAHLRPFSGASEEVHNNFGTSDPGMILRSKSSAVTGVQGLYAIYADAYRDAAKLRGILPREMQSITWEAVRGLYKPQFKKQKNIQAIDAIWGKYKTGEIDANEARTQILNFADPLAFGINNPFWKNAPGSGIYGGSGPALNTGNVGRVGLQQVAVGTVGRGTKRNARGTPSGVKFSAAPVAGSDEFNSWFNNSQMVNPDGSPMVHYHGTPFSFDRFKGGKSASVEGEQGPFFFSSSAKFANQYAETKLYKGGHGATVKKGGRILPVWLSVQNPFDYDNPSHVSDVAQAAGLNERDAARLADGSWRIIEQPRVQQAIRDLGFDGFHLNEAGFKNIAVYSPNQVKSIFNQFVPGAATDQRFSAAPLPAYVQQQNSTLFAPIQQRSVKDTFFNYIFGHRPAGKTINTQHGTINISDWQMRATAAKAAAVDKTAFITLLESELNKQTTGNFQRTTADYSATAAFAWLRRASHIFAASMLRGNIDINFDTAGDINSATINVVDDQDSLKNIFSTLMQPGPIDPATQKPTDKRDLFRSYAVAKRGEWLAATGQAIPKEITPQYIRETVSFVQQEYPEVVEAYNSYQRYNKKLLTTAAKAGIISTQELARLTNQMNYYGFIYEVYGEPLGPSTAQKAASKFKLRAYTGTQYGGLTADPMFVMIQNAQFWTQSIAKNLAATKAFNLASQMDEARLLNSTETPDEAAGEQPDVMFFSKDGVIKRFAVRDPLMVTALGSDDRINVGKFWEMVGLPTKILRESVTRDPGFMVANLMRDTLASWMVSGADIKPFIGTVKGMAQALKKDASYKALQSHGVVGSYDLAMLGPEELADTLRRNTMPKNVHIVPSVEGASAAIRSLWNRMGALSEASDAATRIAVYDAAIKNGATEAEASMQAIELLDFTRRGGSQTLGILTKLIPFLNARIQGLDVFFGAGAAAGRYVSGRSRGERDANIGKKFLFRGAMLAAISIALEMLNDDDEEYAQLDDYIKNSNLLVSLKPFGIEGEFLAIPKPFEAGILFSTLPQQMYKTFVTGEASSRENANIFFSQMSSTFGVNPIPQILLPAYEVLTNHSFFTGLPVIQEGKARLDPSLQYNQSTSQLAMILNKVPLWYDTTSGKFTGLSPTTIDHLINGYGGPLGTYLVQATSIMMQSQNIGPDRMPIDSSRLPVVKRFFIDAEKKNPKVVTQAYELFRMVDEVNRSASRLKQLGDAQALKDYLDENRGVLKYKKYVFKLTDTLNKLSAKERNIERDPNMTRDEKLEAMDQLRAMRVKLAAKVSDINKDLGR